MPLQSTATNRSSSIDSASATIRSVLGALAIGVADRLLMLEYSTYSVISPEGCASILWKRSEKAEEAASAMGITSARLLELGLIDEVIREPLGGAHRDVDAMAAALKQALLKSLNALDKSDPEQLVEQRYLRLMNYGSFREQ